MSFSKFDPVAEQLQKLQGEEAQFNIDNLRSTRADNRARDAANRQVSDAAQALENRKALDAVKRRTANYDAGIKDPEEVAAQELAAKKSKEANMSDFEKYSQKNDYDLGNQQKAWESASTLRMKEADQSNVAQKDRLVSQLDNQKNMQQAGFNQTNKLRSDDNQRAVDGFKMSF